MEPQPSSSSPSASVPAAHAGEEPPSDAERERMARRIVQVGELSRFVLALRAAVREQTGDR